MVNLSTIRQQVEEQQGTIGFDSAEITSIAGSGVTIVETLDSLPMTGLSAGDEAFVKGNNRLYISNGSGWYNTTLVNRSPTWATEPDATYEIADSVTPLVITALATDSDNPDATLLNQSIASDSAQYMVDISNDSSVWTFTPKTASQIGAAVAAGNLTDSNGDFVYTFKWSDGVSFISKAATISYSPSGGGGASSTGFLAAQRWSTNYAGGEPSYTVNGITQSSTGDYYQVATEQNEDAGWINKYDETGTFQWAREFGTYYIRMQDVTTDTSGNAIAVGHDYGYGDNTSPSPQLGYAIKFNSSGTVQWQKVIRWANFGGSHSSSHTVDLQGVAMDGYGNIWTCTSTYMTAPPANGNTSYQNTLIKLSNTDGSVQGSWQLPGNTQSNTSINAFIQGMSIDTETNKMYLTFTIGDPTTSYHSSRHIVIQRISIPSSGNPTIDWSYIYGRNYGSTHDDRAYGHLKMTSDGNIILSGFSTESGSTNHIVMKIQESNGSIIWQKKLDNTYFADYPYYNAVVDNNDKIWIMGQTGFNGNTYMRVLDGDDGSHVSNHEIAFKTGAGNYSWQRGWWTTMRLNKDGNVISSQRHYDFSAGTPPVWIGMVKFPASLSTGSSDNNNFTATAIGSTPSDTNWNASKYTHTSFSINTSAHGYEAVNYNSGTHSDTVRNAATPHSTILDVIS